MLDNLFTDEEKTWTDHVNNEKVFKKMETVETSRSHKEDWENLTLTAHNEIKRDRGKH